MISIAVTFALLGCVRAVKPNGDLWVGDFALDAPSSWEITRNYRFLGNSFFTLTAPDRGSAITVEMIRETHRQRRLPLRLVSDVLTVNVGRASGIEAEVIAQHELLVAERRAWATTAVRRHGPQERLASQVALRGERHVVLVTLHTPLGGVPGASLAWQRVLDSLALPGEPAPADIPMIDLFLYPPPEWDEFGELQK